MRNKKAIFVAALLSMTMLFSTTVFAASPTNKNTTQQAQQQTQEQETPAPTGEPVYYTSGVNEAGQAYTKADVYRNNTEVFMYGDPIKTNNQGNKLIYRANAGMSVLQTPLADRQNVANAFAAANPGTTVTSFFLCTADGQLSFTNLSTPGEGKAYYYVGVGINQNAGQIDTGILIGGKFMAKKFFAYAVICM